MSLTLIGILGVMLGSVANALISRLPLDIPWHKGRSVCDSCKHELTIWDLFPVFSFLFLLGRCRYCRKPIPVRNLFVELLMAVGFGLAYYYNLSPFTYFMIFSSVVIGVMDWESMLISDKMLLILGVAIFFDSPFVVNNLWGLLAGGGFIAFLWLITKRKAMGEGDIFLMGILGYWLGLPKTITALWWAFVIGAIVGLWQLATRKKGLKSTIAFGPFLLIGAWIAYTWGCGVFCF